jgi:23S rRNA (uracil1939-C5)-methyltransferase
MPPKKSKYPRFEKVKIEAIASQGKAIARVNDMVVFIPGVIPGDVVDLQVNKKKKKYMEAYVTAIHEYSTERQDAFCSHFGVCGGCKWQILPYANQLKYKQQEVFDNFSRLGKFEMTEVDTILGSTKTTYYRNKLEFSFSNKKWLTEKDASIEEIESMDALGFHVPGRFDKIVDIEECFLQASPSNEIRNCIKQYAIENNLEFYDIREQTGFLRTLIIRTSTTGDLMVIATFFKEDAKKREALLEHISNKFPQITSLMYVINEKGNDTITDQEVCLYKGVDYIFEEMEGIKFKIGPKSFYQTNSEQAYELYKVTREFAALSGNEIVYDLYTGTGTIANFVAKKAKKVVGIEYIQEAIDDAIVNSQLNNINNTSFFAGDMKDVLNQTFIDTHGRADVLIIDPPRSGMHEKVIDAIKYCSPQRIVYVSCNPSTQARDIDLLADMYKVQKIQPVDMFPHTHHVENVVLLTKKDSNENLA